MQHLFVSFFCLLSIVGISQIAPNTEVSPLNSVDLIELPPLDNALLKRTNNQSKHKPFRFAEPRDLKVTLSQNGTLESTKSGQMVWRQRIKSPNAHSINLGFTSFALKPGVQLYIYNSDKSDVIGPFTEADNDDHLQLWTPMIQGDEIIIEVIGNANAIDKSKLVLSRVNHDFVDIIQRSLSGSCNLDVVCGAEDGWEIVENYRDIISSVGAFTLNGIDQCSGMLINNTAMDCKPYFITANHCEVSNLNSSSVVVYWNYENQTCREPLSFASGQPGNGPRNQFNSGSKLRANLFNSDFALLELDDPIDPNLGLFFSGWDLSGELTDTSICIHHPNVEEKRISFDFNRMIYETGNMSTNFVRVLDWDIGTTEPGSSGAPIFNSEKRFIGQLQGGFAACGNDDYDSFGFINYSWDRNNSVSSSLKPWLDPLGTGQITLDGRSCSIDIELSTEEFDACLLGSSSFEIDIEPSPFFVGTIKYNVVNIPNGLDANLLFLEGVNSENNQLIISGFDNLTEGEYEITISAADNANSILKNILINVISEIPKIPEQVSPVDFAEDLNPEITLSLKRAQKVLNEFQIALDEDFNNIVFNESVEANIIEAKNLKINNIYYWRSKASNACGDSEWSEVFQFSTESSFCTHITSQDGPKAISPSIINEVESKIIFNYPVRVQDINIENIVGTHDYLEDLIYTLKFNNKSSILAREICNSLDDFNFGFDDESENAVISCPPTNGDLYKPLQSLSTFDNVLAGGEWRLNIQDTATDDGGELESWTAKICFFESQAPVIVPEYHTYDFCKNQHFEFLAFYNTLGLTDDIDVKLFNESSELMHTDFYISKDNELNISFNTETLIENKNAIQLVLSDANNGDVLAISSLDMMLTGDEEIILIESPTSNQSVLPDGNLNVSWDDNNSGNSYVEISDEINFSNIIYGSYSDSDNIDVNVEVFESGNYYVRVASEYECGVVFSEVINFTIGGGTATDDSSISSITIYPNPSSGQFYLRNISGFQSNTIIELFDASGKYFTPNLDFVSSNLVIMNIEDYNSGIYIVKIRKNKEVIQLKLVKQ